MPTPVVICDDSGVARKQIARALPGDWDCDVSFAKGGEECLDMLSGAACEVLLLDLTMPEPDGYTVLERLRELPQAPAVIVVSGDIQPEAQRRVLALGARAFIRKPVNEAELAEVLSREQLLPMGGSGIRSDAVDTRVEFLDGCRELANVAMGQAADLLARLLHAFVVLPVPNVAMIEGSELRMALSSVEGYERVSAVCQGFIGSGIAGEALLLFNEASFEDMARLMNNDAEPDQQQELELMMDLASVLIGACLRGIAEQLDITFSQDHPSVLDRHRSVADLLTRNGPGWGRMLAIELHCTIEDHRIDCDLLLLFTDDSMTTLEDKVAHLL